MTEQELKCLNDLAEKIDTMECNCEGCANSMLEHVSQSIRRLVEMGMEKEKK